MCLSRSRRSQRRPRLSATALFHLFGDDVKFAQLGAAEVCGECNVGGVATDGHENAADASLVVTRIKSVPFSAEENFEPRAKIHRVRRRWNPNIAQVTGDITRRDIEASTKGNCEMHEITANTLAIAVDFHRAFLWIGEVIAKSDVIMHPIADRLRAGPARLRRTKKFPRFVVEFVHFTVTTRKQKREHVVR